MRFPAALAALFVTAVAAPAQDLTGIDWQLLALDGVPLAADVSATLRIDADGSIQGQAPCNSYGTTNTATLPDFRPGPIRATKMACDKLAEEVDFFIALSAMELATPEGETTLILTGADGRSMEFVKDRTAPATQCITCAADQN